MIVIRVGYKKCGISKQFSESKEEEIDVFPSIASISIRVLVLEI